MCLLSVSGQTANDQHMSTIELGAVSVTRVLHFDHLALAPAEFFPGGEPELWAANRSWLSPAHWDATADRVRVAVQSWLLRSNGRTILIDTGLAPSTARPGVPGGASLPAALASVGVTPAEVDLVICTHLHADHVGGNTYRNADGVWMPAFANARYLFSRRDVDFFDPSALTEEPGRSAAVYVESIEPILREGKALIWDDAYVIDENLRLRLAPGHTPGHGVVVLTSGDERAVFAGDVLHSPLQVLTPGLSSCFCHDSAEAARTRRKVLQWAADHAALVIPAHFGGSGAIEVARDGSRFAVRRWADFSGELPAVGPLGAYGKWLHRDGIMILERERPRRWAVSANHVEPGQRLVQVRDVAGRHPPQHEVLLGHPVEPLPPPAHEVQVRAVAVHEVPQGFQAFPDRQVDDEIGTAGTQRGGAGSVAVLKAPHEARRGVGGRVDRVDPGHEVRQFRCVDWRADQADVELC